ncbi:MAG TPA: hypothetical protein VFG65_00405, partial [Fimbriimonadales bacterium]|nr:hypothetical protein [Fimbriimonadales bacterium]
MAPAVMAAGMVLSAHAQIPLQDGADDQSNQALIGKPAIDMMPGKRKGLGYPLRFGGVVEGSVAVEVSGQSLKEGADFSVDYAGGVVYISADIKDSDSIRVR